MSAPALLDIDWFQVAMLWRDLYMEDMVTRPGTSSGLDAAKWHEVADGWRNLYYSLLARTRSGPTMGRGRDVQPGTFEAARARNRSRTPGASPPTRLY